MNLFVPEGDRIHTAENMAAIRSEDALRTAAAVGDVLEAQAFLCDSQHALHVDLPCMEGIIPHEEGAIGIAEGTTRDIALISRVGKPVCFTVEDIVCDGDRPIAMLSRKNAQLRCLEQYMAEVRPGDVLDARVTRLEGFGVFCDVGCGLPALLPIACLSVSRISHPSERLAVGDRIRAVVTSIENGRICLSLRELLGTWEQNAALFSPGETVMGVVRSVESYGIFVELAPNLAGLAESKEGIVPGMSVGVYIKSILPEKMKIKLVVIDASPAPSTPVPLRYFEEREHIDEWDYAPPASGREIRSVFDQGV
ncbi:MAG: S1 RNA-binding domain-containing protein [Clostridia bacterium]|nr:S1 RNA-binding domain-containing protein [Clostridia bacterium]